MVCGLSVHAVLITGSAQFGDQTTSVQIDNTGNYKQTNPVTHANLTLGTNAHIFTTDQYSNKFKVFTNWYGYVRTNGQYGYWSNGGWYSSDIYHQQAQGGPTGWFGYTNDLSLLSSYWSFSDTIYGRFAGNGNALTNLNLASSVSTIGDVLTNNRVGNVALLGTLTNTGAVNLGGSLAVNGSQTNFGRYNQMGKFGTVGWFGALYDTNTGVFSFSRSSDGSSQVSIAPTIVSANTAMRTSGAFDNYGQTVSLNVGTANHAKILVGASLSTTVADFTTNAINFLTNVFATSLTATNGNIFPAIGTNTFAMIGSQTNVAFAYGASTNDAGTAYTTPTVRLKAYGSTTNLIDADLTAGNATIGGALTVTGGQTNAANIQSATLNTTGAARVGGTFFGATDINSAIYYGQTFYFTDGGNNIWLFNKNQGIVLSSNTPIRWARSATTWNTPDTRLVNVTTPTAAIVTLATSDGLPANFVAATITATNGISGLCSNLLASTSITFPATTVNWTNPLPVSILLYIVNTGVTGTVLKKNGSQISSTLTTTGMTTLGLQVGEYFSETYTVGTPTATYHPFP